VCHSHANKWMLVASYGQCMLHRLIVKHCLLRWCWKHVDTIFLVIWCVCNVAQCLGLVDFFLLLPFLSLYFFVKVWRCHIIYFLYLIWSLFFYLFFINFVFQFSPSSLVFIGSFVKLIYFSVSSFNIWFFWISLHASSFFNFFFVGLSQSYAHDRRVSGLTHIYFFFFFLN